MTRTCELVMNRVHEKGLELVLDTDHLPDRLYGDPTRLSQALLNLLGNAVKFTQRGSIVLRGELLADEGDRLLVRFEVRDTGIGIAADKLPLLFKAFEQADSTTTRRFGGSGLGLAITRRIAELMGGEVGVQSTPGQGSRFWFTARLERARSGADAARQPVLQGLRALLVDDLPQARDAIADMLGLLGMKVDTAASGAEALGRWREAHLAGQPHAVLLIDWLMPGLDGLETLKLLREQPAAAVTPAVLVTAHDDEGLRLRARSEGFDDLLAKPVTPSMLHDSLIRLLRRATPPLQVGLPGTELELMLRQQHRDAHLLLVEDNPVNQEVALELLQGVGLTVAVADNGRAAVAMAEREAFDLILMDVQMPEMDGLQATRAIRALPRHAMTPILAMTANAFGEDRAACIEAGMDDHVGKPVDPPALYAALLRWLPGRASAGAARAAGGAMAAASQASPAAGLPPIDGLDLNLALRYCGGDTATCLRVVRQFASLYGDQVPGWPALLGATEAAEAERQAHSLRGASAAIGALALQALAGQLEAGLREGRPPLELQATAAALGQALTHQVAAIRAVLGDSNQASST